MENFKEIFKLNSEQIDSIEFMLQECAGLYFEFLVSYFEVLDSMHALQF